MFETIFVTAFSVAAARAGYWLYATVAVGVSLMMYIIYVLAMDLPQAHESQRPWGDTTILFALALRPACVVAITMVVVRVALIVGILGISLRASAA